MMKKFGNRGLVCWGGSRKCMGSWSCFPWGVSGTGTALLLLASYTIFLCLPPVRDPAFFAGRHESTTWDEVCVWHQPVSPWWLYGKCERAIKFSCRPFCQKHPSLGLLLTKQNPPWQARARQLSWSPWECGGGAAHPPGSEKWPGWPLGHVGTTHSTAPHGPSQVWSQQFSDLISQLNCELHWKPFFHCGQDAQNFLKSLRSKSL